MNLPSLLLLFTLYTIVFAAIVALIYFTARRPRATQPGLTIPNLAELKQKAPPERTAVLPVLREALVTAVPAASPASAVPAVAPVAAVPAVTPSPTAAPPRLRAAEPERTAIMERTNVIERASVVPRSATPRPKPSIPRSISDVFNVSGQLLPEALRTLEVTPGRIIEPGASVRATFTFRNPGGGTANGFRVRFRAPDGLTYVSGSAQIDETPIDDVDGGSELLQPSGADIGEIPAGGERRASLEYLVASMIENSTQLAIQAAVASLDVPVIGSNIVRLIVRSMPVLQNAETTLDVAALKELVPGEELQISARIYNSGQSSAHDLVALLPVPTHTTYSPQSVLINGRSISGGSEAFPFGLARPTVVTPTLAPGAGVDISYRVRIDSPLEDATRITAQGSVCSQEVAEFSLPPVGVKISSAASFASDDTSLWVECADEVEPGERVRIVLHAKNAGTAPARKLYLRIALPEGMVYTAGSLEIEGAPVPDRGSVPDAIRLGDLEPGRSVEMALSAIVYSPIADGHELRLSATVAWSKGQRKFERALIARSAPRFPASFNKIERETPQRVGPGDPIAYTIALQNMGTDVATEVRLQITADEGLENLHVHDRDTEIVLGDAGTIAIDTLEPGVSRVLRVDGRVAGVIEDQTQLRLHATLMTAQIPRIELGARLHVVDSRPRFSLATSRLVADSHEALRFKRLRSCRLILVNEGTDSARDVRVALQFPPELRLERVDDGTRDGNTISFGDIPAGERREATLGVRLVGIVPSGDLLAISAHVSGFNVVPFGLPPVELTTNAQASFAEGATLASVPADTIDAGAEISYTLFMQNSGDGAAKRLTARIASLSNAVYAQGSTTINGIALQDYAGTSPLLSGAGLTMADVGAGVEVTIQWRVIVNMPLPPATVVETTAAIGWDETPEIFVEAAPVVAQSTSALPIIDSELPFSVLGAIAAPPRAAAQPVRAQLNDRQAARVELSPAVPVRSNGQQGAHAANQLPSIQTIKYDRLAPGNETITPERDFFAAEDEHVG
jgi:uncharacterized repeat protein (TIGR01451 family)